MAHAGRLMLRRRGFANTQLLTVLGLALLFGLGSLLSSGQLGLGIARLTVGKQAAAGTAKTSSAKGKSKSKDTALPAPPLFPQTDAALISTGRLLAQRRAGQLQTDRWQAARARRSLARMHGSEAAAILTQLPDAQAVALLRGLDEHQLGQVLSAAEPQRAAEWLALLSSPTVLPPFPSVLPQSAGSLSAAERLDAALAELGYGPDGSPLPQVGETLLLEDSLPDADEGPNAEAAGTDNSSENSGAGGAGASPADDPVQPAGTNLT